MEDEWSRSFAEPFILHRSFFPVFRHLLRSWLSRTAQETIRNKASEAVRQAAEGKEDAGGEQRPLHCDVGLVFALGIESGGLEDLLPGVVTIRGQGLTVRRGTLKRRRVVLIQSGAGREAAARATDALIDGHHPEWIISAGLAGGLSDRLRRNDLVMGDAVVDEAGHRLSLDLRVDPQSLAETPGVHVGTLLCADRVVRLSEEKRQLGATHQALAIDMETFAVAEVCRRRQVRFLAVRVIGDPVDEEFSPEIRGLLKQATRTAQFGAALGAIWRRPGSVKEMYRLRENALVASDRLARFLSSVIEQLSPLPPARG